MKKRKFGIIVKGKNNIVENNIVINGEIKINDTIINSSNKENKIIKK